MWKYWITTDNVFWNDETIDRPSKKYLDSMNWKDVDLSVDLVNPNRIEFYSSRIDVTLIKIVNDENNQILYYRFNKILKYNKNNYLLEFVIDYWCMYTLDLIEKEINVLVDRHQDYDDDKCLDFSDEPNVDLSFENFEVHKNHFKTTIHGFNWKYIYDENTVIRVDVRSELNPMYCLVLNSDLDLNNQGRTYIPILAESGPCKFHSKKEFGSIARFWIVDNVDIRNKIDIPTSINQWVDNLDRTKNWVYRIVIKTDNDKFFIYVDDLKKVQYLQFSRFVDNGLELRTSQGIYFLTKYEQNETNVTIYVEAEETYSAYRFDVKNNYNSIVEYSKKDFVKKVDGLYLIPNILNLSNLYSHELINNNPFLVLRLNIDGNPITKKLTLFKDLKIDTNYKFNNENIQFKYLLKFFNVNYLNNDLDISKYWKDDKVELDYSLMFTNSFNLVTNNEKFTLDNRLLELPSKQSFPVDEYAEYVASNMNTVNTGYEITKQQAVLGGIKGVLGSIMSGVVGSALGGNALGVVSGVGGAVNNITSNILSVANYEKQIKAKYADAKNTLGDRILFGATKDMLWNRLINDNAAKYAFDLCMYKKLSTDSIIQLNNYYLLNGVYNPKYFKLNNLPNTTAHLGFKYAKLNSTNFNQIFSKYLNVPLNVKEKILAQLQEFRIWEKIPSIE